MDSDPKLSSAPDSDHAIVELRRTLRVVETLSWRAEIKAMVLAAATSLLLATAVVLMIVGGPGLVYKSGAQVPCIIGGLFALLALGNALVGVAPSSQFLWSSFENRAADEKDPCSSIIDFTQIRRFPWATPYLKQVESEVESVETLRKLYSEYVWERSTECHSKHVRVAWSLAFLVPAIFFGVIAVVKVLM